MIVDLDKIVASPEAQSRERLDDDVVSRYAEAMRAGDSFPSPIVFFDGAVNWLADGFHRVAARRLAGIASIPCDVRKGGKREAILHSVGANATHGLPRTNADKRRAVEMLLRDAEWGAKSDRWIAEKAAVSGPFVAKLRPSGANVCTSNAAREGKDGKTYPAPEKKSDAKKSAPASVPSPSSPRLPPHANAEVHQRIMADVAAMTPDEFKASLVDAGISVESAPPSEPMPAPRNYSSGARRDTARIIVEAYRVATSTFTDDEWALLNESIGEIADTRVRQ